MSEPAPPSGAPEPAPQVQANASGRQMLRNFATGYLGLFASLVLSFILTPIVLHHLGDGGYGLWIVVTSVGIYIGLLGGGVGTALTQLIAVETALGNEQRVGEALATARRFFLVTSLTGLAVTGLFLPFVGPVLDVHAGALTAARWGLLLMAVYTILGFMVTGPTAALTGSGYSETVGLVALVVAVVTQGAQLVLVELGGGIVGLVGVTAAGAVITLLAVDRAAKRRGFTAGAARPTRAMLRELTRSGLRNVTVSIGGTITYGLDSFVIGTIVSVAQVAPYDIALSTTNLVRSLATTATDLLLPAYAHSSALEDKERQFRLFTRAVLLSMALLCPMVVALIFFGPSLLGLWLGHVPRHTYEILVVLNVVYVLQLPGHQAFIFLTGVGRNRLLARIALPLALLNVILSVAATFWLGAVGPAVGNIPQMAVVDFVLLPLACCRATGNRFSSYLRLVLLPLVAPIAVAIGLALVMVWTLGGSAGWRSPIESLIVVTIPLAAVYPVIVRVDPSSRELFRSIRSLLRGSGGI